MVLRTFARFASKRVPLIKFRKGGTQNSGTAVPASNKAGSPGTPSKAASNAIEDWELPSRYKRKPIDAVEMEYINRGGPA